MQSFAIIPAAGESRRMGQPKLLLPWGRWTVIEQVLSAWHASDVTQIVAVVHPDDQPLAERCGAGGAIVVRPDEPPAEMKDSIRLGLERAAAFGPHPDDAWLVAPADLPGLAPGVIDRVLAAYAASLSRPGAPRIWVPRCGAKRGHPVLFSWALAAEVSRLAAGEGLNALVDRHDVGYVEVERTAIADDLDTPEDYERLRPGGQP